ncbi:MAG TPA: efflux RND transporter periplasmic adaptor subunit [Bacteroidales bacterium]|nr:efflux RND transporter periplasmic adaptor subunit [Bacteroidales bacterium]HPR57955.1 efflux RND transporter periplasmic adaptor subunit [Bacteroidales bacterium]
MKIYWENSLRFSVMLLLAVLAIFSCKNDDYTRLEKLKNKREQLDKKIREVEQRLLQTDTKPTSLSPAEVEVINVKRKPFSYPALLQGKTENNNTVFLMAERRGIIQHIYVKQGDYVKKDQILINLDNTGSDKSFEELQNAVEMAEKLFERQKELREKNLGTDAQYFRAKLRLEDLKTKMNHALKDLSKNHITSPINGVVDHIAVIEGQHVEPGTPTIRIINFSAVKIRTELSENLANIFQRGDTAKIEISHTNVLLYEPISNISPIIDPIAKTFDVEILIPANPAIKPGMTALITLKKNKPCDAVIIPISALSRENNMDFVFVAVRKGNNWFAEKQAVSTGFINEKEVEITGGLNENDILIVSPLSTDSTETRIVIKNKETQ